MGHLSRQPNSNDPLPRTDGKSRWLEDNSFADETCLLLNDLARRCKSCKLAVRKKYLNEDGLCPDCQGPGNEE